uniref:Uncharacterized protein n=1 Tax=Sander lucioperca TaxID=283035 RepID=A0A8D0D2T7_SANLU
MKVCPSVPEGLTGTPLPTCRLTVNEQLTRVDFLARFNDRIAEIKARPKTEWAPKPWPPKSNEV